MVVSTAHVTSFENTISLSCIVVHLSRNIQSYPSDVSSQPEDPPFSTSDHAPLIYVFGGSRLLRRNVQRRISIQVEKTGGLELPSSGSKSKRKEKPTSSTELQSNKPKIQANKSKKSSKSSRDLNLIKDPIMLKQDSLQKIVVRSSSFQSQESSTQPFQKLQSFQTAQTLQPLQIHINEDESSRPNSKRTATYSMDLFQSNSAVNHSPREEATSNGSVLLPQNSITLPQNLISFTPPFTTSFFVTQVACGIEAVWYKTANGEYFGSGCNRYGELGPLKDQGMCSLLQNGIRIKNVTIGREHSIGLLDDGRVYATGSNLEGQLGFPLCSGITKEWKELDIYSILPKKSLQLYHVIVHNVYAAWDSTFICLERVRRDLEVDYANEYDIKPQEKFDTMNTSRNRRSSKHSSIERSRGSNTSVYNKNSNATKNSSRSLNGSKISTPRSNEDKSTYHQDGYNQSYLLFACGANRSGQLGLGHQSFTNQLQSVIWPQNVHPVKISSGANHIVILDNEGIVWGCGSSSDGQLGSLSTSEHESLTNCFQPLDYFQSKIVDVACGDRHTVFLDENGCIYVSGYNGYHACGIPEKRRVWIPTLVEMKEKIVKIACGWDFTVLLDSEGVLFGCGRSSTGALGPTEDQVENVIDEDESQILHTIDRKVFPRFRKLNFPFHDANTICFGCGKDYLLVVKDSTRQH